MPLSDYHGRAVHNLPKGPLQVISPHFGKLFIIAGKPDEQSIALAHIRNACVTNLANKLPLPKPLRDRRAELLPLYTIVQKYPKKLIATLNQSGGKGKKKKEPISDNAAIVATGAIDARNLREVKKLALLNDVLTAYNRYEREPQSIKKANRLWDAILSRLDPALGRESNVILARNITETDVFLADGTSQPLLEFIA